MSVESLAETPAEVSPPSATLRWLRQFAVLLPFVGVAWLAWDFPPQNWWSTAFWLCWTSYFLFCWTSLFHETVHLTLPKPRWFTVILGRAIGTVLLTPYTVYREAHIRHHAYLNRPNDWELWPYSDPHCSLGFRRAFAWADLVLGLFTSPYIYSRIYFHPTSPIRDPSTRRAIRNEYLAVVIFWGAILGWVSWVQAWPQFLLAWVIPHWLAGIVQTGRKFTEHLGMSSFEPVSGTRTVVSRSPITRLCSFLNFEIFVHGPHHRFPRIQHHELKNRMQALIQQEPETIYPLYSSYLAATWAMLPALLYRPGVGLNAGGNLNQVSRDDVQEFVEDARELTVA